REGGTNVSKLANHIKDPTDWGKTGYAWAVPPHTFKAVEQT
ncbi:hypothetical protein A2U01_0075973, partial [Trifolium medium]|nr:hypothetical protein [Trifolium medium]